MSLALSLSSLALLAPQSEPVAAGGLSIATLGTATILLLFILSLGTVGLSVLGALRRSERLIEGSVQATYACFGLAAFASSLIIYAFLSGDYSIQYVQHTSDAAMPLFYKITAFWGGLDGSLLFWVLLHTLFGSLAVRANRMRHRELIPHVVAVLATVTCFFVGLLLFIKDPFSQFLLDVPSQGRGLNPLLQNLYMIIHPPSLYLGYVSLAVPYAFGMAALFTGQVDASWQRSVRRWVLFSWMFLTFGLILGGLWAYEELGWGGYWAWDPVENAGLLPWFTATAFLHSVMIQERRGMMKAWNLILIIVSFLLTIVGTFMTRARLRLRPGAGLDLRRLHAADRRRQLRPADLAPAAAALARRARERDEPRVRVPRQQLAVPAVRHLRAGRHHVADLHRVADDPRRALPGADGLAGPR